MYIFIIWKGHRWIRDPPHLQGYIKFTKQLRITGVKKIHHTAHWEVARGSPVKNIPYCKKNGDFIGRGIVSKQGQIKCDILDCIKLTLKQVPTQDILDQHGSGYVMNISKIDEITDQIDNEQRIKKHEIIYKGKLSFTSKWNDQSKLFY